MSLMEISKSITQNLDYSERNQILPKNDTQKSGSSQKNYAQKSGNSSKRYPKIQEQPQKNIQNNGTSPYHDICKLPSPPPPPKKKHQIKTPCKKQHILILSKRSYFIRNKIWTSVLSCFLSGLPLTWKTWKSQGIWTTPLKVREFA